MRKAFSLIELLIVLAIVGGIAALLFPLFSKVRDNARRASCQANLKQVGLGFMQYCRDYDEKMPRHFFNSDGAPGYSPASDQGWMQVLQPYIKSVGVFQCPSEGNPLPNVLGTKGSSDYWLNFAASGINLSLVSNSSRTVFVGEGDDLTAGSAGFHSSLGFVPFVGDFHSWDGEIFDASGKTWGHGAKRHLSGSNFLFFDGHVKWLTPDALDAKSSARSAATFRID